MTPPERPRPARSRSGETPPEAVLAALQQALGPPGGPAMPLRIEWERRAGRSSIYLVGSSRPVGGRSWWVVKQPHTDWTQDDLASPVSAHEELAALTRLHVHFDQPGRTGRVPAPIALLPTIDAFAMEFVPGRTIRGLLTYGSVQDPSRLLRGLAAAAVLLRDLHSLESLAPMNIDLGDEARRVLSTAAETLHPLGLAIPARVQRTLLAIPPTVVRSRHVVLHGDFGPGNVLMAEDGSTVGLDPSLRETGPPEEDLVRFIALMSGSVRFAPELAAPPLRWFRRRLESQLLSAYYTDMAPPPLFELRLLHQLVRRWPRARELLQRRDPPLLSLRLRVLGAQMNLLMEDSGRRLRTGATGGTGGQ